MEPKSVVTSFLQHDGKVLILKRSEKVGTHQGLWAGISGYLEKKEEPLNRAFTEIKEEIDLSRDQVDLVKAGEPIGIPDAENDVFWVVYPHLFKTESVELKIDWEHTEYNWIEPEELVKYQTVPALNETLQKVLPTSLEKIVLSIEVLERIELIKSDRSHGATHLAVEAVQALVKAIEGEDESSDLNMVLPRFKILAERLMGLRPSMAPFNNLVGELLVKTVKKAETAQNIGELKMFVREEADRIVAASEEQRRVIAEKVFDLIPENGKIVIHSYSSTVQDALKYAHDSGRKFEVIVTEARPLFEGRTAAKELAEHGIPVTLVTDAAAVYFATGADLVLLGADSLFADGSVVNKVGTYSIVLAAAYHGAPIYILAGLSKVNLRSFFSHVLLEEKDASEVWNSAPDNVTVRNLYFDLTPKFFINGIITEIQKLRPDELLRVCQEIVKERYII
jgi:ribose 1,5-bisphosphate isomerase